MRQLRNAVARLRSRLGTQDGSVLIEVLVGALVLAIVTVAVLDGLDGAQATGRKNKSRSVQSTLAQQDIERLRALPIPSLVGLSQTRTVDVNGVSYTVISKAVWYRDTSGELSCIDDTSQASFLKVTSTVSSGVSQPGVTETTLITPPAAYSATTGTATVRTTDRDGNPMAGVQITLSGAGSYTGTTNALGCAIFSFIPTGAYKATVPGNLVSWNSEKPANAPFTVTAGKTTPVQMELAQPASLRISFKTSKGVSKTFTSASIPHPNLTAGVKVLSSGTAVSSFDVTNLFPQKDGYGVYAGNCAANNPANPYWGDPDYFENNPGSFATVNPGSALVPVTAIMPVLTINVARQQKQNVYLRIDETDAEPADEADCRKVIRARGGTAWVPRVNKDGTGPAPITSGDEFVLPFGTYTACIDDGTRRTSTEIRLDIPAGRTIDLTLPTGGASATC